MYTEKQVSEIGHKMIDVVVVEMKRMSQMHGTIRSTCLECNHWDSDKQICGKYQALPPPRVIAYGCPDYSAEIPF